MRSSEVSVAPSVVTSRDVGTPFADAVKTPSGWPEPVPTVIPFSKAATSFSVIFSLTICSIGRAETLTSLSEILMRNLLVMSYNSL